MYRDTLNHRFHRTLSHLKIGDKINFGYGAALGVAILGITTGFIWGDFRQQQAIKLQKDALEEIALLNRLQISQLQTRAHRQELISLLTEPALLQEEYADLLKHQAELRQAWLAFQASEGATKNSAGEDSWEEIETNRQFLQTYQGVPESYLQQVEALLQPTNLLALKPEEIELLRSQLINFGRSPIAVKMDDFSEDFLQLFEAAREEYQQAEIALKKAEIFRLQVIVVSLLLSVAIATLLATFTSRAIARPIQVLTEVAQQSTQAANFDLLAPVTTKDEVGDLAISFNHLISHVKQLLEAQKVEAARQLIQSEKMSSLGQMMTGVAHEINNPVNFIYGNLNHTSQAIDDLLTVIELYEVHVPQPPTAVQAQSEAVDLEFLKEDLPKMLQSMQVGAERVRQIVLSLKNFARLDETTVHPVDLHACIDSTLLLLNHRLKQGITLVRDYNNIPVVEGFQGSLYQVFMNVLSNALDALAELKETDHVKQIVITTERLNDEQVAVRIADTGPGMAPEQQTNIFDAFFTTKPRGVGTGLGLSISHQIVVEQHKGHFTCQSQVGEGTEFSIVLPLKQV